MLYTSRHDSPRYTTDHVKRFLTAYTAILSEFVDLADERVYVMEKPSARIDKGKVKDGIHVIIPGIVTEPDLQFYVREKALADAVVLDTFKDIGIANAPDDCLDEAVIKRNNWLMYASSKPDHPHYEVTRVFKYVRGDMVEEPLPDDKESYIELLSIRNKHIETDYVSEETRKTVKEWYARNSAQSRPPTSTSAGMSSKTASAESPNLKHYVDGVLPPIVDIKKQGDIEMVEKLVPLLSEDRFDSYEDWMNLHWICMNVDPGQRMKDVWDAFSSRSVKYDQAENDKLWLNTLQRHEGEARKYVGTLANWAEKDNPEGYKRLINATRRTKVVAKNRTITLEQATTAANLLVRALGHDPSDIESVKEAVLHKNTLSIPLRMHDADMTLQFDMSSLLTKLNSSEKYLHADEPIDVVGTIDPGAIHKDIRPDQSWKVKRPDSNSATFLSDDHRSIIQVRKLAFRQPIEVTCHVARYSSNSHYPFVDSKTNYANRS